MLQQPILTSHTYHLRLEPLTWQHEHALYALCQHEGLNEVLYNSVPYAHQLQEYMATALEEQRTGKRMPFVVVDTQHDRVMGTSSFYDIQAHIPRLDIGYTWYGTQYQKTYVNRVCKYLLLRHAFEQMYMKAVGFRTDHLNTNSQRAILALGAKQDGVLRCHLLRKDGTTIRDSHIYSILLDEWPEVKAELERKIMTYSTHTNFCI